MMEVFYVNRKMLLLVWISTLFFQLAAVDQKFCRTSDMTHYENYEEFKRLLQCYHNKYPNITKLSSIGKSVQGKEMWYMQITDNPNVIEDGEPMFKYVGNMHGNEVISRQVLIYLIEYLCDYYNKDSRIKNLVDSTNIFILPSMNPDGFAIAKEGDCGLKGGITGRNNANNKDLNRNFPDQFLNWNSFDVKSAEPETRAMMRWIYKMPFVLSANLHGGSVVASYPFDSNNIQKDRVYSKAPDDAFFKHLALTYSQNHPVMKTGKPNCPDSSNETFEKGITNGAQWYNVPGGMQDFNYLISNCFEITIELSCCKYPYASTLKKHWNNNKESLLKYIEQVHRGVKGKIVDENNAPIQKAEVSVLGLNHNVRSIQNGDYWRLLLPGTYNIQVKANGFIPVLHKNVKVSTDKPTVLDFVLRRDQLLTEATKTTKRSTQVSMETSTGNIDFIPYSTEDIKYIFDKGKEPKEFKHHNYKRLTKFLLNIKNGFPSITRLYSIGKSIEERELWVLEVSTNPGIHIPGQPEFKYIANMHGNEVVGRECLLLLIQFLCENYNSSVHIQNIINNSRLHFLPSLNPDGYERAMEGDREGTLGRENALNDDLNRNFPDQFDLPGTINNIQPETEAIMNWLKQNSFVLSVNLHGGALVANYPYDDSPNGKDKYTKSPDDALFRHLATVYSDAHPMMHFGNGCIEAPDETFNHGITNGAQWYSVSGGMQDYNYLHSNCFEITIEMGCYKFPPQDRLKSYWEGHKIPLLRIVMEIFKGLKGFVKDINGIHIAGASIDIFGINHTIKSLQNGDYFRLLIPGIYKVTASKQGYQPNTKTVHVKEGAATQLNFTLNMISIKPKNLTVININNKNDKISKSVVFAANNEISNILGNISISTTEQVSTNTSPVTSTVTSTGRPTTNTNFPTTIIETTSSAKTSKPKATNFKYHTYAAMQGFLNRHQSEFPDVLNIHDISKKNSRSILCAEITSKTQDPSVHKVNVALVAGLHGYDTIGREVLLMLIHSLTTLKDTPRVRKLLNSTKIHIIPMFSVQDMDKVFPGDCTGEKFPSGAKDFFNMFSKEDKSDELQEVKDFKSWMKRKQFLFTAVVQGGEMFVSYPPNTHISGDKRINGRSSVDEAFFKSMALHYSVHNRKMYTGKTCNGTVRNHGVAVGLDWRDEKDTLSMYAYLALNQLSVDIHLSCCRNPPKAEVHDIWTDNKESLLQLIEMSEMHVYGKVTDVNDNILPNATLQISGTDAYASVNKETGFYQKFLTSGTYTLMAEDENLDTVTEGVAISESGHAQRQDFVLLEKPKFEHHKYNDMMKHLRGLVKLCPKVSKLYSIGKSVKGKNLMAIELSDNPGKQEAGEPEFVYMSGLHGNELVGRELLLLLARHLCVGYGHDPSITNLLDNTRIHLLPLANPDGAERAREGSCFSDVGKNNANGVDLNEDFPVDKNDRSKPTQPESEAIKNWLDNRTSVVYAALHSGSLVVSYPFSERWNPDSTSSPTPDEDVFQAIAKSYASRHPTMANGRPFCPGQHVQENFKDGIVNIAKWSGHSMPMLDYHYVTGKALGVAIYTGCCKAPNAQELNLLWKNHKKALLNFMNWSHKGIMGNIYDSKTKKGIAGATIKIDGRDFITKTSKHGDYWRTLNPGSYKLTASHKDYMPRDFIVHITSDNRATNITFSLKNSGLIRVSAAIFLALISSCILVFILVLILIAKVCQKRRKLNRIHMKNGFRPLQDMDEEEFPLPKDPKIIGQNGVLLDESEISDDDEEEEVIFSDTELKSEKT